MTPLPCPFCGGTEVSVVEGSTFRWSVAECDGCGARCGEIRVNTTSAMSWNERAAAAKADAIDEWNRRAPMTEQQSDALVDAWNQGYETGRNEAGFT